ncbi:hypothetical protein FACS1894116_03690 [Betaproteobacteria bacterium]|nr:hypothetical protein FACS1894116_03690 [Betaproteobacteria bacterium]
MQNRAGISLNRVSEFNVDVVGLIFNNSGSGGGSLLGGQIGGNPNLTGVTASTIVTEVYGALPSQLGGPLEVFGAPAWAIIANPNGVICNGCGILNAPRLSLAAGTLDWRDSTGQRLGADEADSASQIRIETDAGQVSIGRSGIEGTRALVDLIGGEVHVDGAIRAGERLNIRGGAGQFSLGETGVSGSASNPSPTPGQSPRYVVDASAFGAMSAGAIDIEVSGQGVGVRAAADLAARTEDLRISANGDIELASTYARTDSHIQSLGGGVKLDSAAAQGKLQLDAAGHITSSGALEAIGALNVRGGGDVRLSAVTSGADTALEAGHDLSLGTLESGGQIEAHAAHDLAFGQARTNGDANLSAGATLSAGVLSSTGNSQLNANRLELNGEIIAGGALGVSGADLILAAPISAAAGITLESEHLSLAAPDGSLRIGGDFQLDTDALTLDGAMIVTGHARFNVGGNARFGGPVHTGSLDLSAGGDIDFNDLLSVDGLARILAGGRVSTARAVEVGQLELNANAVVLGGALISRESILIDVGAGILENTDVLAAGEHITLLAGELINSGAIIAGGHLDSSALTDNSGLIVGDTITLSGGGATSGQILGGILELSGQAWANSGQISADTLDLNSTFTNLGTVGANTLALSGPALQNGGILSADTLNVSVSDDIVNTGVMSANNLGLSAGGGISNSGALQSSGGLSILAQGFGNSGVTSGSNVGISLSGGLTNSGTLAGNTLNLQAGGGLNNSGQLQSSGNLTLQLGGALTNTLTEHAYCMNPAGCQGGGDPGDWWYSQSAGAIVAGGDLTIHAGGVSNQGTILSGGDINVALGSGSFNNHQSPNDPWAGANYTQPAADKQINTGLVFAAGELNLSAGALSNSGAIGAGGDGHINVGALYGAPGSTLSAGGTLYVSSTSGVNVASSGLIASATLDLSGSGPKTIGAGQSWTSSATHIILDGELTNYGAIALSGEVTGDIKNLPTLYTAAGAPPEEYHASCPVVLTDCVALSFEGIATRAVAEVGSLSEGSVFYNESSFAALGGGAYQPAVTQLQILWEGLNADGETEQIIAEIAAPEVPELYVPGTGFIELVAPNPGIIVGDNLVITGANIINASPADLAAAQTQLDAAQAIPAGGEGDAEIASRTRPRPVTVRAPNALLNAYQSGASAPTSTGWTRPEWANQGEGLMAGTIRANQLLIDASGYVVNFGALAVVGDKLTSGIHAAGLINERGQIDGGNGAFIIETEGELLNHQGTIQADQLGLYTGGDLVNLGGKLSGATLIDLDIKGNLTHRTEGEQRAEIASSAGTIQFKVGGDALIDHADMTAAKHLIGEIDGELKVLAHTKETNSQSSGWEHVAYNESWGSSFSVPQHYQGSETRTRVDGISHLQAGGTLSLTTGADITLEAAELKAGEGKDDHLILRAGGNLNLNAVEETQHTDLTTHTPATGTRSQRTHDERTYQTNSLQAGGKVVLGANRNIVMEGGQIEAGSDVLIAAGLKPEESGPASRQPVTAEGEASPARGTVDLKAVTTLTSTTSHTSSNNYVDGISSEAVQTDHSTRREVDHGVAIQAGGKLDITGTGDVTLHAVTLEAQGDMTLASGGNLNILSGQDRTESQTARNTYGAGAYALGYRWTPASATSSSVVESTTNIVGNTLTSAGKFKATAAGNLTLETADVQGSSIDLTAGNAIFVGGKDATHERVERTTGQETHQDLGSDSGNTWTTTVTYTTTDERTRYVGSQLTATAGDITARAGAQASAAAFGEGPKPPVDLSDITPEGQPVADSGASAESLPQGSIVIAGSTLNASGKAGFQADGDIIIAAGSDNQRHSVTERENDGARHGREIQWDASSHQGYVTSGINAGSDLIVQADGNVSVLASALHASTGDISVSAGGRLEVIAAVDRKTQPGLWGDWNPDQYTDQLVGGEIRAGGNIWLESGAGQTREADAEGSEHDPSRDMVLTGTRMTAGGKLEVDAGGDLLLGAVQLGQHELNGKDNDETFTNTHAVNQFNATGDITLSAGNDLRALGGAAHSETGDVTLYAGRDVDLAAVVDTREQIHDGRRKTTTTRESEVRGFEATSGAEGRVYIRGERDVTVESVNIEGGSAGAKLSAGRDLYENVAMAGYSKTSHSEDDWFVWSKTHDRGLVTGTAVDNRIEATGGVEREAGNAMHLQFGRNLGESEQEAFDRYSATNSWAADISARKENSWEAIQNTQESWNKHTSGLSEFGNAIVIAALFVFGQYYAAELGGATTAAAVNGTATSAAVQFVASEGEYVNWGQALRGGLTAGLTAGVAGNFGDSYSLTRLLADTAVGCVGSALNGGQCQDGAVTGFGMNLLAWGADSMRNAMIGQSRQFPGIYEEGGSTYSNISGPALPGEWKIGGERLNLQNICAQGMCTPMADGQVLFTPTTNRLETILQHDNSGVLGGLQGGKGRFFWMDYGPGSWQDQVVEAYGGPHDWLNGVLWGGYETVNNPANLQFIGNAAVLSPLHGAFVNIMNYVDVPLATPFAISSGVYSTNTQWLFIPGLLYNRQDKDKD